MWNVKQWILLVGAIFVAISSTEIDTNKNDTNINDTNDKAIVNNNSDGDNDINISKTYEKECKIIEETYAVSKRAVKKRSVSIFGKPRNVTIYYGVRSPSRAAGALLVTAIRYALGYQGITLRQGPRTMCELAKNYLPKEMLTEDSDYDELVVHLGAEWKEQDEDCEALHKCEQPHHICGPAGPRFYVMGPRSAPMAPRLQVRLAKEAWTDPICADVHLWPFYTNMSALAHCQFLTELPSDILTKTSVQIPTICSNPSQVCLPVLVVPDWNNDYPSARGLAKRINDTNLPLYLLPLQNDSILRLILPNINSSILFLDYDLWADEEENRVRHVQTPSSEFDTVAALRVGDAEFLREHGPPLFHLASQITFPNSAIQEVLITEAQGNTIENAACHYAFNNFEKFNNLSTVLERKLWAYVLLCDDGTRVQYYPILKLVGEYLSIPIVIKSKTINCNDPNDLTRKLMDTRIEWKYMRMIGVVSSGAGVEAAAYHAQMAELQLVFFDVPGKDVKLNYGPRTANGRLELLVNAINHFIEFNRWERIAVIKEHTQLANDFTDLLAKHHLKLGNETLESLNTTDVKNTLQKFLDKNAKVFFVNTGPVAAGVVLCKALDMGLTPSNGYAWIVREWNNNSNCDLAIGGMKHFVVSYWWRGGNDSVLPQEAQSGAGAELRRKIDELWPDRAWPQFAAPMADALLLLADITAAGLSKYPSRRYDLHGDGVTSNFSHSYSEQNPKAAGVVQYLTQGNFAVDEPLVFVDSWSATRELLAVWRVNATGVFVVNELNKPYKESEAPRDGASLCLIMQTGDPFYPTCHDAAFFIGVAVLALAPLVLLALRRARLTRLAAREKALHVRMLARCERTAAALEAHLIDRSALVLQEELGTGHFGRVRLGMLKLPHRPVLAVAVKALREDAVPAEEAEFLREACALAALSHEHVVRLVGVCAADGPPLLLMEHAFFGDLQRYLRERRYLVNLEEKTCTKTDSEAEAVHVSPSELTRLAREAASALAYLERMRYVHRDVRAANCLINDQRVLKLADFGMARATGSKAATMLGREQDDYKYICQRRGVFPVPWMAPESLLHGVFSSASDVWALGVLMLELATLGGRPFGAWRPPQVLKYVREGGHPLLPRDISYHTSEVIEMCWRRAPDVRPSAEAVRQYLELQPTAIRPALRPAWPEQALEEEEQQGDSGFAEREGTFETDPRISTM